MLQFPIAGLVCAAALFAGSASIAGAQTRDTRPLNIFEALFPGLIQERLQRQQLINPIQVEKISAPKYFTYVADKLVRIDLKSRVIEPQAAVNEASPQAENSQPVQVAANVEATSAISGGTATNGVSNGEPVINGAAAAIDPAAAPAVEQAVEPLAAPAIDPAIAVFGMVAQRFGEISVKAEPVIAKAVAAHYAKASEPMWIGGDLKPNARSRAVLAFFASAEDFGLESADYAVAVPGDGVGDAALEAARFEVDMTARAIRYAMDASAGRINPNRLSGYHDFPENRIAAETVLEKLQAGGLPGAVLAAFHPDNAKFAALKAELENLSLQKDDAIVIAPGTLIKPGEVNGELGNIVAVIRKKASEKLKSDFAVLLASDAPAPETYSPEIVELVKAFQKEAGLGPDGVIGRGTIAKLADVGVAQKRQRVLIAMEELRWLPRDLGAVHVFVNQPAFRARFVENGKSKLDMRVVVGTPANQTSFFHDVIETVEYNPFWGIPQSILVNEYLPKLRANPSYLDERGYIVTDAKGRRIPSSYIDWWAMSTTVPFDVKQSPGEANALGELKILFPNKHAIYMHDTPQKKLFGNDQRAFSHGCIRLQQPREMAAAVLGTTIAHIEERLKQGHNQEEVSRQIPVYVAYFTAWPDDNGKVEYFDDVYGRDLNLQKALSVTRDVRGAAS